VREKNIKQEAAPGLGENEAVAFREHGEGCAQGVPRPCGGSHDTPAPDVWIEDVALERSSTAARARAEFGGHDRTEVEARRRLKGECFEGGTRRRVARGVNETIRIKDVFAELARRHEGGSVESGECQPLESASARGQIAAEGNEFEGNFDGLALGSRAEECLRFRESVGIEPELFADLALTGRGAAT